MRLVICSNIPDEREGAGRRNFRPKFFLTLLMTEGELSVLTVYFESLNRIYFGCRFPQTLWKCKVCTWM
jgi:hypothetical protein